MGEFVGAAASIACAHFLQLQFLCCGGVLALGRGPVLALAAVYFAALLLQGLGWLGLGLHHRSRIAYGVFAYGLAAASFWIFTFVLFYFSSFRNAILPIIIAFFLLGLFFLLQGAAFIALRRGTKLDDLCLGSGLLFSFAGLLIAFGWTPVGFLLLLPAGIIGGTVFARGIRTQSRGYLPVLTPLP